MIKKIFFLIKWIKFLMSNCSIVACFIWYPFYLPISKLIGKYYLTFLEDRSFAPFGNMDEEIQYQFFLDNSIFLASTNWLI